jgi:hypothetical protein
MDSVGATWLWAIFSLLSLAGVALAFLKPAYRPLLTASTRSSGRGGEGEVRSPHAAQFSPVGADVEAEEDVPGSSTLGAAESEVDPSAAWSRHGDLLHQYRVFVGICAVQATVLFLFTIALVVNAWESVIITSPVDPTTSTIEIVLGLTSRDVRGAPAGADARWKSGHYSDVCSSSESLTGCAFPVLATGGVVLVHGLIAILSMFLVLAYLLLARNFPFILQFGSWVWRFALVQAVSSLSAALLWAIVAHSYEGSRNAASALDASFFIALLVGVGSIPFAYLLRVALISLDGADSQHWRQLNLLDNEGESAAREQANVQPEYEAGRSSSMTSEPVHTRPRSESETKEDREHQVAIDSEGVDLDPTDLKRPTSPSAIAGSKEAALGGQATSAIMEADSL